MNAQSKWKEVEYSRSQIIKAGKTIRKSIITDEEKAEAIKVIDNWRAAHAFPMHVIYIHLRRFKKTNDQIIVAERLKRLDSIVGKLAREEKMNLWTMQDLGGCRVIVPSIEDVYEYVKRYDESRKRHIKRKMYDYIANPKESGYRGIHVVYEYRSDKKDTYNKNMLVEIQFRTHLQHIWATAVETMGIFMRKAIKSGEGDKHINRFFALVSTLIAYREDAASVPNTPTNLEEVKSELRQLNQRYNYLNRLNGIRVVTKSEDAHEKKFKDGYCVMGFNYKNNSLSIKRFSPSNIDEANLLYNRWESSSELVGGAIDVVLVRVSSFSELKVAYPNYFNDISEFVHWVRARIR